MTMHSVDHGLIGSSECICGATAISRFYTLPDLCMKLELFLQGPFWKRTREIRGTRLWIAGGDALRRLQPQQIAGMHNRVATIGVFLFRRVYDVLKYMFI